MKESLFKPMTMAEIELEAASLNCEVVVAKEDELQFDLDDDTAWRTFNWFHSSKLLPHWPALSPFVEWKSKSGNRHVVVSLPELFPIPERIAMQVMGGSDPGREWASLNCYFAGSIHPILLYRPLPKLITADTHKEDHRGT